MAGAGAAAGRRGMGIAREALGLARRGGGGDRLISVPVVQAAQVVLVQLLAVAMTLSAMQRLAPHQTGQTPSLQRCQGCVSAEAVRMALAVAAAVAAIARPTATTTAAAMVAALLAAAAAALAALDPPTVPVPVLQPLAARRPRVRRLSIEAARQACSAVVAPAMARRLIPPNNLAGPSLLVLTAGLELRMLLAASLRLLDSQQQRQHRIHVCRGILRVLTAQRLVGGARDQMQRN